MTTFELPAEPPIGSKVEDRRGNVWTRSGNGEWHRPYAVTGWGALVGAFGPLTLIDPEPEPEPEPEPWPTAAWIVADVTDGGTKCGRRLLYREPGEANYWAADGMSMYPDYDGDTLTNVVEVTPVPVAQWEALVEVKARYEASFSANALDVVRAVTKVLRATTALGVDS